MILVRSQTSPKRVIQQSLAVLWLLTSSVVKYLCLCVGTGRNCLRLSLLGEFMKLYNYHANRSCLIKFQNRIQMKISSTAKFAPSLFLHSQEQEFQIGQRGTPFKQVDNITVSKSNRKRERKNRTPKPFLEKSEEQNEVEKNQMEKQLPAKVIPPEGWIQIEKSKHQEAKSTFQRFNPPEIKLAEAPKLLLELDFEDQEAEEFPADKRDKEQEKIQTTPESLVTNLDKIKTLDLSNSSERDQEHSAKVIELNASKITDINKNESLKAACQISEKAVTVESLFERIMPSSTVHCVMRRDKKNKDGLTQYNIYFQKNLKHILTVRKESMCQYVLYLRQSKGYSFSYSKVATLDSNFFGSKYTLLKPEEEHSQLTICYQTNFLGLNGPRKLHIYIPKQKIPFEYLDQAYENKKWEKSIEKCVNKSAKWSEKANSFILSFKGRALKSSIKNFVITDQEQSEDKFYIIFGKAAPDVYNLDIESPFNLIQGIAVAISSFERKFTCD